MNNVIANLQLLIALDPLCVLQLLLYFARLTLLLGENFTLRNDNEMDRRHFKARLQIAIDNLWNFNLVVAKYATHALCTVIPIG
ncbi:hypothetical protein D3C85_1439570 [compost metagenome]